MFSVLSPSASSSFSPYVDLRACRRISIWLIVCCVLVVGMVSLGGYTRLSGSGLSMPTWQPFSGFIPPLSDTDWQEHYRAYSKTPEYRATKPDLASFKMIFWVEYSHRALGRVLALAFLLPFLFFAFRRYLTQAWIVLFSTLFVLGALQGLMGWLLVHSGLVDEPQVSPYRLSVHLSLAFLLYGLLFSSMLRWTFPDGIQGVPNPNRPPHPYAPDESLARHLRIALVFLAVTLIFGALVAGHNAGAIYGTYPLMDGSLLPPMRGNIPWYQQIFATPGPVQWMHRLLSLLTAFVLFAFVYRVEKDKSTPRVLLFSVRTMSVVLIVQFTLGITTLLYAVPTALAMSHQIGALLLLSVIVWLLFAIQDYKHSFLTSTSSVHGQSSLAARSAATT